MLIVATLRWPCTCASRVPKVSALRPGVPAAVHDDDRQDRFARAFIGLIGVGIYILFAFRPSRPHADLALVGRSPA